MHISPDSPSRARVSFCYTHNPWNENGTTNGEKR